MGGSERMDFLIVGQVIPHVRSKVMQEWVPSRRAGLGDCLLYVRYGSGEVILGIYLHQHTGP